MPRKTALWATLVACLDLFTKLSPGMSDGTLLPGILTIHKTTNTGVAFGMLQGMQWLITLGGILGIILLTAYVRHERLRGMQTAGFALILGGAAGNLIDRLLHGFVHDWLMFAFLKFPVFNVADAALTIGAVVVAFTLLMPEKMHG